MFQKCNLAFLAGNIMRRFETESFSKTFAHLEDHQLFNRTWFSFTGHKDTTLLISRSDLSQPEMTVMQFCC